jgi:hypothetical protein
MSVSIWVVTASADHTARGRREGIVQANHGKPGPILRLKGGDGVVVYAPRTTFPDGPALQAFASIGRVTDRAPWQADLGGGFVAWRREVVWHPATEAPIRPLLDQLELTRGERNWGMAFRYGLRTISPADFAVIEKAMGGPFTTA